MYKRILITSFHNTGIIYNLGLLLLCFMGSCVSKSTPDRNMTTSRPWTKLRTEGKLVIPEKIWLHRTNHPDKFKEYADSYTGFELDVNINESGYYFEVYHLPEKPTGIDFSHYLTLPGAPQKYFWLDCKNLDSANTDLAIRILDLLDKKYQIKNRILVESTNPIALKRIHKAGYKTIFYLSSPNLNGTVSDTIYLQWLVNYWDDQFLGVSAEAQYIPLLNAYLPSVKKMTWCSNLVKNVLLGEKRRMMADSSVLIVLEKR